MSEPSHIAQRDELAQLLEATYSARAQRLPRRELLVEAGLTLSFLAATVGLILLAPPLGTPDASILLVVAAYVIAGRVNFPLGAGNLVPTQPFLVALFALAPAPYVPLLVFGGLVAGAAAEVLAGRLHRERLVFTGANAMHALGPAAVLQLGGAIDATQAGLALIVVAFASQVVIDLACSIAREWLSIGLRPEVQARVVAHICVVDAALTPLGILVVAATDKSPLAALAVLPLVGLFAYTARERFRATERAHERLVALERERRRLRVAVQRIGEAFASNLDLDALLQIVTRAAVEALDGTAGRASSWLGPGRALRRRAAVAETPWLRRLLDEAEMRALKASEPVAVAREDSTALAVPLLAGREVLGVVTIARGGTAFDEDERALLAYLCEQAAIAAANVTKHEALHRQALTDELTGLANHRRFQELLTSTVERRHELGLDASLILLDIDDFKAINDLHGHQVGDTVLRAVGRALREACRATDEPARYGGEELAIVLPDTSLATAAELAERIRREIEDVDVLGAHGEQLRVTVSGGVAALGDAVRTKAALISAADNALYRAKAAGKNRIELAARPEASVAPVRPLVPRGVDRTPAPALEGDLRRALDAGELFLQYQPIVRLASGGLAGVEALVRWRHPTRGILAPADFVPLAEKRGLIVPLGEWVLEEACRQGARWAQRWPGLFVGVNVSLPQLTEDDFPAQVERVLRATGLPPGDLVLELTESVLMHDVEATIDRLAVVRELGPRIAVDDFGTGHSSLQYLLRLPLDVVKVPETFVRGLDGDASGRVLTRTIIDLAHRLGLGVVAEGVERREQLRQLEDAGCELAQGFLFAPGLHPDALEALLAAPAEDAPVVVGASA